MQLLWASSCRTTDHPRGIHLSSALDAEVQQSHQTLERALQQRLWVRQRAGANTQTTLVDHPMARGLRSARLKAFHDIWTSNNLA